MNESTKLILGVVAFLVMINSIVIGIAYNSMMESKNDLESFKKLTCTDQKDLLQNHEVGRSMQDETEYFMSECVLKDNSYQERIDRIKYNNQKLWEYSPYLVLVMAIPLGLWYAINRYYQWGLKEQAKDRLNEMTKRANKNE